jgi:hypothetical protein
MTTPKSDERKALIAKLRDYRIREQPNRFFLDVADALEALTPPAEQPQRSTPPQTGECE